jgi:hypothetical protein
LAHRGGEDADPPASDTKDRRPMFTSPDNREHLRRALLIVGLVVAGLVVAFLAGVRLSPAASIGVSIITSAAVAAARPRPAGAGDC